MKLPWCGDEACEVKIKEETAATSRCIDTEATVEGVCPICGKKQNILFILQELINIRHMTYIFYKKTPFKKGVTA